MSGVTGILLAAGSGSRFGSDKLLHPLVTGVPMALTSARTFKAVVRDSVAVVRPGAGKLAELLAAEGYRVVICANADQGMGASLACAARAAGEADGYLIALADMPFLRPTTIAAVREALVAGAPLAAPYFRARRGHPVGLSRRFFPQLLALRGDEGAKRVIAANEKQMVKIPVGDPGALRDIDRPEDLAPPLRI